MLSSTFWQTQHLVHGKDTNALPGALLIIAGVLVVYRHMTEEMWEDNQLKTFLALIMIQMLPLVLIEMKISSCADPMNLLSRFGSKVLLMHACVFSMRFWYNYVLYSSFWDILWLVGVCITLRVGFGLRLTLRNVYEHRDVLGLVLLAAFTAIAEESISQLARGPRARWPKFTSLVISACNYAEILAFVPAVWMVFRDTSKLSTCSLVDDSNLRMKATSFFAFMIIFYLVEDIGQSTSLWSDMPLAAMGHTAHFLLVLDFAGFMLSHIYSPEKIKDGLTKLTASFGAGTFV